MSTQRDSDLLNHLDQSSITYEQVGPLVRGTSSVDQIEACQYCSDSTPVSQCVVQAHWEKRLREYRLDADRAGGPVIIGSDPDTGRRTETNRLVQMDYDPDKVVVGPLVLPDQEELREVFAMESLGLRYHHEPRRFWPNPASPIGSTYIKTGRMGLVYGQELPHD